MGRRVGLLALLMVLSLGSGVVASESQPPPWFGGRVEMPRHGIAVSIPTDWIAFDLTVELDAQLQAAGAQVGLLDEETESELFLMSPSGDACDLDVVPWDGEEVLDPGFYGGLDAAIRAEPSVHAYEGISQTELPAGPAVTYRWQVVPPDTDEVALYREGFMIGGDAWSVILTCEGPHPTPDRWRAIAESLEWLRPRDTAGMGGRLEAIAPGFALTFPDDWVILDPNEASAEENLDLVRQTHPRWVDTTATMLEQLSALSDQGYAFHALVFGPVEPDGWPATTCLVQSTDLPVGSSLDDVLAGALDHARGDPGLAEGPTVSELMLPAGPSHRIDYVTRADTGRATYNSTFLIDFETALATDGPEALIGCFGYHGFDDRWLSIADSFEFLPAEAG